MDIITLSRKLETSVTKYFCKDFEAALSKFLQEHCIKKQSNVSTQKKKSFKIHIDQLNKLKV